MNRTERLHAVTESLRRAGRQGITAERLAADFEVSTRTIKGDIAALAGGELPVWGHPWRTDGFCLARDRLLAADQPDLHPGGGAGGRGRSGQGCAVRGCRPGSRGQDQGCARPACPSSVDDLADRVWVDREPASPGRVRSAVEQGMNDRVSVVLSYRDSAGARRRGGRWNHRSSLVAGSLDTWSAGAGCGKPSGGFDCPESVRPRPPAIPVRPRSLADIGRPPESVRPVGR